MNIEIDVELSDKILAEAIKMHISLLQNDLEKLYKVKNRKPYQDEDLKDNLKYLNAFMIIGEYIGVDRD